MASLRAAGVVAVVLTTGQLGLMPPVQPEAPVATAAEAQAVGHPVVAMPRQEPAAAAAAGTAAQMLAARARKILSGHRPATAQRRALVVAGAAAAALVAHPALAGQARPVTEARAAV